jgi:hypothetical protein
MRRFAESKPAEDGRAGGIWFAGTQIEKKVSPPTASEIDWASCDFGLGTLISTALMSGPLSG